VNLRAFLNMLLIGMALVFVLTGCGGKLAEPRQGRVTGVWNNGAMLVEYSDGMSSYKMIDSDDRRMDSKKVAKYMFQPAKMIETKKGSTITFPDGESFVYRNWPKDGK
jgi:hypothetical protein